MNPKVLKLVADTASHPYSPVTLSRTAVRCEGLTIACNNSLADGIESVTMAVSALPTKDGMVLHSSHIADASGVPVASFKPLAPGKEIHKGMVKTKNLPKVSPVVLVDADKFFAAAYVAATHASQSDARHYLNGICLDWAERNKLYVVATDGHRMAVTEFDAAHHPEAPADETMGTKTHQIILTHRVLAVFADSYTRAKAAMPDHTFTLTVTNHSESAGESAEDTTPVTQVVRLLAVSPDRKIHMLAELAREPQAFGLFPDWRAVDITRQNPLCVILQHRTAHTIEQLNALADTPVSAVNRPTKRPTIKASGKYITGSSAKGYLCRFTLTNSPDSAIDLFKSADPDASAGTYTYANTPNGWYAQYIERTDNTPKPAALHTHYAPALATAYLQDTGSTSPNHQPTPSPESEVTLALNRRYLGMAIHALSVAAVELSPTGKHTYKSIREYPVAIDISAKVTDGMFHGTRHSHYAEAPVVITSPDAPHTHIIVMPMRR